MTDAPQGQGEAGLIYFIFAGNLKQKEAFYLERGVVDGFGFWVYSSSLRLNSISRRLFACEVLP